MGKREDRDAYADYVDHPRFGHAPRITGLDVEPAAHVRPGEAFVMLHWINGDTAIPGTAIEADPSRQTITTMGVTHYYDLRRVCRDCDRPFIFFAREQKHWYEELGFTLEADAVRCVPCRREQHGVDRSRRRYEALINAQRDADEDEELAEHCLSLMEAGLFSARKGDLVRQLIKRMPPKRARRFERRLASYEAG